MQNFKLSTVVLALSIFTISGCATTAKPITTGATVKKPCPLPMDGQTPMCDHPVAVDGQLLVEDPNAVKVYTIQKDDTLQKISYKVYGSFNAWAPIYEANRDVIKDPNFLKPGVLITIPPKKEE